LFILNFFSLGYFQLCEAIISYFWPLKIISCYIIIVYSILYYHRLFVAMLFVVIVGYSIGGNWWLFFIILLMAIDGY
jgi:hypothetical protein